MGTGEEWMEQGYLGNAPDWLAFNLLCDCCLAVFAFVFVFWVAHLGLPM